MGRAVWAELSRNHSTNSDNENLFSVQLYFNTASVQDQQTDKLAIPHQ